MKRIFAVMGFFTAMCLFGCHTTSISSTEHVENAMNASKENAVGVSNESGSVEVYGSIGVDAEVSK